MSSEQRNVDILEHIIEYCNQIEQMQERFGNAFESFSGDKAYQNAVAMCILQIGELSSNFSDTFRTNFNGVPWKQIRDMRNIIAHRYGSVDVKKTWETVTDDIPGLKEYCEGILGQYTILGQEVPPVEGADED